MPRKKKKGSWVVTITVTRKEEIVCDDCTEEQARQDPWEYHDGNEPTSLEMTDYEVKSVEPNE